jgi:hypothetical protein
MGRDAVDSSAVSLAVADEVLKTIANEHRLKIVLVLGDRCAEGSYGTRRFSEIWEATGLSDSGKLNYHLQQLVDTDYVAHVDDGYRLTLRGLKAYQAVKAGFYAKDLEIEPFELETPHRVCGEPLVARYRDQRVTIACRECGDELHQYPLPPGPFDADASEEVVHAMDVRFTMDILAMSRGFCPYCSGPTRLRLDDEYYDQMGVDDWEVPAALYWCTHCHWFLVSTIEKPVLFHPVVMSFYAAHGVNLWDVPLWSNVTEVDDALISDAPPEILLEFSCGSDVLDVVVDDSLDVLHSETSSV